MQHNLPLFKTCRNFFLLALLFLPWLIFPACTVAPNEHQHAHPDDLAISQQALIDCKESKDTGYTQGKAFSITVVHVDGKPVEKATANAYYVMQQAAAKNGVAIRIVSGFRTMAQQQYLYNCYKNCNCNNCNLAARPGYSNHQSGHALDLNTSSSGVLTWLNNNGARFGFKRTVSSEPWHWEWWGGGPGGGPCGSCKKHCEGTVIVDEKCGRGDCAAFGAKCVDDNLGVRCVSTFCPNQGTKQVCIDSKTLGTCKNGAIETGDCSAFGAKCVDDSLGARCVFGACPAQGKKDVCLSDSEIGQCDNGKLTKGDCGAFGAYCSTAGATSARCVSVFCVANAQEKPTAHSVCLPDGKIGRCDENGAIKVETCPDNKICHESPTLRCIGKSSPKGHLDKVNCDEIGGWSQDPDEPDKSIDVHVYFKGPAGDAEARGISVLADQDRADLCSALGSCKHGFSLAPPFSLFNGREYPVHAYGIDSEGGSNAHLADSPRTLKCEAPEPQGVKRKLSSQEHFNVWKFSTFWDMLPLKEEKFAQIPDGASLPNKPLLVKTNTDPTTFWLVDENYRRKIPSAQVFQAWRFDAAEAQDWTDEQLQRYQEGTPLRGRPMLAEDAQGNVYLFDDAQAPLTIEPPTQEAQGTEPNANDSSVLELFNPVDGSPAEILTLSSENGPTKGGCACNTSPTFPFEQGLQLVLFFLGLLWVTRKNR